MSYGKGKSVAIWGAVITAVATITAAIIQTYGQSNNHPENQVGLGEKKTTLEEKCPAVRSLSDLGWSSGHKTKF